MPAVQATGGEGMRSRGGRENGGDLATDPRCEAGCRGRGGVWLRRLLDHQNTERGRGTHLGEAVVSTMMILSN